MHFKKVHIVIKFLDEKKNTNILLVGLRLRLSELTLALHEERVREREKKVIVRQKVEK